MKQKKTLQKLDLDEQRAVTGGYQGVIKYDQNRQIQQAPKPVDPGFYYTMAIGEDGNLPVNPVW